MRKKILDTLKMKELQLKSVEERSIDAVKSVHDSMNYLQSLNDETANIIEEIDDCQKRLAETREGLTARQNKNQQILQNFRRLLCEE